MTSLRTLYKTDQSCEKDGVRIRVTDTISFTIRRYGGSNSQKVNMALAKFHKPYATQIYNKTISEELLTEVMAKVFVESCLVSWEGVVDEDTGRDIDLTPESAVKLFIELPELFNFLLGQAQNTEHFKETLSLGNS